MKKFIAVFLVAVTAMCAFAEKKATYKVVSVVGKVTYATAKGTWEDVTPGMEIAEGTEINTGLNSNLILTDSENVKITIKPMKKGLIQELAAATHIKTGVKVGSKVTKEEIDTTASNKKSVQTASSRASEAKEDLEWE